MYLVIECSGVQDKKLVFEGNTLEQAKAFMAKNYTNEETDASMVMILFNNIQEKKVSIKDYYCFS